MINFLVKIPLKVPECELNTELSSVDYQISENNKFKFEEESNVIFTISKRERTDQFACFEYEEWMDEFVEKEVVENLFDFTRALKLIQLELKIRNVKNWELFNVLDLRNKWTEFELQKYRKIYQDDYIFTPDEDYKATTPAENTEISFKLET